MDIGFEILLPAEAKVLSIKFEQPIYEWEGEKFPQGQEEAWLHYFRFIRSTIPDHIVALLPSNLQKNSWQCISIVEGIDQLVDELSVEEENTRGIGKLLDLLSSLIGGVGKWVIIFEPDYDRIDEVLAGDIDIASRKIVASLTSERNGFVIWFEGNN